MIQIHSAKHKRRHHYKGKDKIDGVKYTTDNLLSYEWVESTQGPPRKYYSLTPEGETFLQGLEEAWSELANTVNHLKRTQNLLS